MVPTSTAFEAFLGIRAFLWCTLIPFGLFYLVPISVPTLDACGLTSTEQKGGRFWSGVGRGAMVATLLISADNHSRIFTALPTDELETGIYLIQRFGPQSGEVAFLKPSEAWAMSGGATP